MTTPDPAAEMTAAEAERLSLIRYQVRSIAETLRQPAPVNTLAINVMQDAVESTLGAVGEHIRADVASRSDFAKLFDAVASKLGSPAEVVGLRAAALALNSARVGFKHHGNQVRDETLRRHNDVAVTLVDELVRAGFGVQLNDISMLIFVSHLGVREFIQKAESQHQANDLTGALSSLRSAFDLAVHDYVSRKSLNGWDTIFHVGPRMLGSAARIGDI